tara:strand:+ start:43 stop:192 length:150 start_codon:yes stop_codon:yes gene_type:complete
MAKDISVGAHRPTKIPNLSEWAGSCPDKHHTAIEHATETKLAVKQNFDN